MAIFKIVTPGGKEEVFAPRARPRIFSDGVAYEVSRILQANVPGGTGTRAQIGVPVAGKTGTTDDFSNAWFVGYTPEYSTAVWVGYPDQQPARCTACTGSRWPEEPSRPRSGRTTCAR